MKSSMPTIKPHTLGKMQNPMPKNVGNVKWLRMRKKIRKGMFE
jgi:hypothetical protein